MCNTGIVLNRSDTLQFIIIMLGLTLFMIIIGMLLTYFEIYKRSLKNKKQLIQNLSSYKEIIDLKSMDSGRSIKVLVIDLSKLELIKLGMQIRHENSMVIKDIQMDYNNSIPRLSNKIVISLQDKIPDDENLKFTGQNFYNYKEYAISFKSGGSYIDQDEEMIFATEVNTFYRYKAN